MSCHLHLAEGTPHDAACFTRDLISFIEGEVATHDDEPIELDTDLLLTGLVDSLGVVLIVDWMEERLGISIDPADVVLENFQMVRQMVEYAQRREAVVGR
jgi:acyl carrier protein